MSDEEARIHYIEYRYTRLSTINSSVSNLIAIPGTKSHSKTRQLLFQVWGTYAKRIKDLRGTVTYNRACTTKCQHRPAFPSNFLVIFITSHERSNKSTPSAHRPAHFWGGGGIRISKQEPGLPNNQLWLGGLWVRCTTLQARLSRPNTTQPSRQYQTSVS